VGSGLVGFMKRTFELPFSLLQPLMNHEPSVTPPEATPPEAASN
jgi:hypothetical protein